MFRLFFVFLILCIPVQAKHQHLEKEYQAYWCNKYGGTSEYILDDKTRVDCLLPNMAIEFDFANKWAESIGQCLYYALKTNKKPAVVLIMENPEKDEKYYNRLKAVADKYDITIFKMFSLTD